MNWDSKRAAREIKRALERAGFAEAKFTRRGVVKAVGFEVRIRRTHIEVLPWVMCDSPSELQDKLLKGYVVGLEHTLAGYKVVVSDDRHEPRRLIIFPEP